MNPRLPEQLRVSLMAHDAGTGKRADWAHDRREQLANCVLMATGNTGLQVLGRWRELALELLLCEPRGGDQQNATRIAEGRVEALVFFIDPLFDVQGADPRRRCGKTRSLRGTFERR